MEFVPAAGVRGKLRKSYIFFFVEVDVAMWTTGGTGIDGEERGTRLTRVDDRYRVPENGARDGS